MQRVWDALEEEITRRRLPERMILALADAAMGFKVRNATYRPAAAVSIELASRDLKALADAGLLEARGERRGRFYLASEPIKAIRAKADEPKVVKDPFDVPGAYLPGLAPPLP